MIRNNLLKSFDFERFYGLQKKIKKSCIFFLTSDLGHGIIYEV